MASFARRVPEIWLFQRRSTLTRSAVAVPGGAGAARAPGCGHGIEIPVPGNQLDAGRRGRALARRNQGNLPEDWGKGGFSMNQYEMSSVDRHQLTWGFLLAQTYQLYAQRFWIFFRIGVPPALVVYLLGQG